MKTKEQIQAEEKIGDVFTTNEFTEFINKGCFNSYDGGGVFHDGNNETSISVWDNDGEYQYGIANQYPYVMWFNK